MFAKIQKMTTKQFLFLGACVLLLCGFLLYANSFQNEMFWDDDDFILKNNFIKDWRYFPYFFKENLIAGSHLVSNYWRPLLLTVFSVEWHLWGSQVFGWHVINTLFHALDSALLFILLHMLFNRQNRWLAFLAALLFLIHPVHTEAVVYINALSDALASLFVFSGLIAFVIYRQAPSINRRRLAIFCSVLCYIFGLMSKESAFVLPALIAAMDFLLLSGHLTPARRIWNTLKAILPFLIIAGIYVVLRATVLNFSNTFNFYNEENLFTSSFSARLFTFCHALTIYAGLLFAPIHLQVERLLPVATSALSLPVLTGMVLFFGMVAAIFTQWHKRPVIAFGFLWFLIGIAPSSNLFTIINAALYEHFLYLPMIGIMLIVVWSGQRLATAPRRRTVLIGLLSVWIIFLAGRTVIRNLDWKTAITFYEQLLPFAPTSYRVINNLGMEYAEKKIFDKAEATYKKAIALDPSNAVGHHNLAGTYRDTGRTELAIEEFRKAIELQADFIFSYKALAQLYLDENRPAEARRVLETYLPLAPDKLSTLELLANLGMQAKDYSGVLKYLRTAQQLDPRNGRIQSAIYQIEQELKKATGTNF